MNSCFDQIEPGQVRGLAGLESPMVGRNIAVIKVLDQVLQGV